MSTEGDKAIVRDFANRWKKADDLRKPFTEFRGYYLKQIDANFERGGGGFGAWKARKKSYPWRILRKTGRMRHGFKGAVDKDSLTVSNDTKYFRFHQLGTRKLPKRKMWGVRQVDYDELRQTIQKYLVEEK